MEFRAAEMKLYGAFFVGVIFGGLNAIGIRFVVAELPPFWGATLRFAPAALLLFGLAFLLRLELPRGKALIGAVLYGILQFGVAFGLAFWSLQTVPPGLGQVILALTPLLTLLIAILVGQESFRWMTLIGGLIAVGGIAVIFWDQIGGEVTLLSLLGVVLAAVSFAAAIVLIKGFPQTHPVATNAVGMAAGAAALFIVSLLIQEPKPLPELTLTWLALLYLILVGSCLVFILSLYILQHWTASATSYILVLTPFVTLLASSLLGQERITPIYLVGGALVLLGVYLGALRKPQAADAPREAGRKKSPLPEASIAPHEQ